MTTSRQSYDPYKLINEVAALLRDYGLSAELSSSSASEALGGAGKLLRAFGIEPLIDPVESFHRVNSRVWSEEDGLA